MKLKAFYESDCDNIPPSQGLYAFYLNAISPSKLGLVGNSSFSDDQLVRAKSLLISKLSKINSFYRSNVMSGTLIATEKSSSFNEKYILHAHEETPSNIIDLIKNIPVGDIYQFVSLASSLPLLTQPIYIGITKKQTLSDRYTQHKYDFYSNADDNRFGVRLRLCGFNWDDIVFACTEFRLSEGNMNILAILEKYYLTISKPLLSIS